MTLSLVSTVTVGAGGATVIDMASIPQTATDLLLVVSLRSKQTNTTQPIGLYTNDGSATVTLKKLVGSSSGVSSTSGSGGSVQPIDSPGSLATANTFSNMSFYFPNYATANIKTVSLDAVSENNATGFAYQTLIGASFSGTTAITSVSVYDISGVGFAQYSTVSLYTITKGSGGATVA